MIPDPKKRSVENKKSEEEIRNKLKRRKKKDINILQKDN